MEHGPDRPRCSRVFGFLGFAGILLAHFAALCFVATAVWKVVPAHRDLFQQSGVVLPARTQHLITMSNYSIRYWDQYFVWAFVTDATIVAALYSGFRRRRWIVMLYSHLWLIAASFALLYVAIWLTHGVYRMVN